MSNYGYENFNFLTLGVIITDLWQHTFKKIPIIFKPFANILIQFVTFMTKSIHHGAQTTLYCTLDDEIENESGFYYADCARKTPSKNAQSEEAAKKLWDVSEKLVGLK